MMVDEAMANRPHKIDGRQVGELRHCVTLTFYQIPTYPRSHLFLWFSFSFSYTCRCNRSAPFLARRQTRLLTWPSRKFSSEVSSQSWVFWFNLICVWFPLKKTYKLEKNENKNYREKVKEGLWVEEKEERRKERTERFEWNTGPMSE